MQTGEKIGVDRPHCTCPLRLPACTHASCIVPLIGLH